MTIEEQVRGGAVEPPDDPVAWARHFWREQHFGEPEDAFIAMSSVLRFHRLISISVESTLKAFKLNLTDYTLLMTLQLSESGTRLISQLAKSLLVHSTTATLATDRLEGRGLILRTPHATDRRATDVTITEAGRALVCAATEALGNLEFGLRGSTRDERTALVELLARLRTSASD